MYLSRCGPPDDEDGCDHADPAAFVEILDDAIQLTQEIEAEHSDGDPESPEEP